MEGLGGAPFSGHNLKGDRCRFGSMNLDQQHPPSPPVNVLFPLLYLFIIIIFLTRPHDSTLSNQSIKRQNKRQLFGMWAHLLSGTLIQTRAQPFIIQARLGPSVLGWDHLSKLGFRTSGRARLFFMTCRVHVSTRAQPRSDQNGPGTILNGLNLGLRVGVGLFIRPNRFVDSLYKIQSYFNL